MILQSEEGTGHQMRYVPSVRPHVGRAIKETGGGVPNRQSDLMVAPSLLSLAVFSTFAKRVVQRFQAAHTDPRLTRPLSAHVC